MKIVKVDRSRIETAQRCHRLRYHQYHDGPEHIGIDTVKKPLPLVVGGSVHKGLETLLREGQALMDQYGSFDSIPLAVLRSLEDQAVIAGLADFSQYENLELDTAEQAAMSPVATLEDQLNMSLDTIYNKRLDK